MDDSTRPEPPKVIRNIFWLVLVLLYLPLLHLLASAFIHGGTLSLHWFGELIGNAFLMDALNRSLLLGFGASLISTIIGAAAALGFRFQPNWAVSGFSYLTFLMPELAFALSLLSWFAMLKFSLGIWSMLLAHVTFSLSFTFFICRSRLEVLESWLEEAALDLGASPAQTLFRVHLPILVPTLTSCLLVSFLLSFDDFLISYFVGGSGSDTLPMKLFFSMKAGLSPQLNALAALMAMISGAAIFITARLLRRR